MGEGVSGAVFDGDLQTDVGQSIEIAVKFYDPDTQLVSEELGTEDPREVDSKFLPNFEKEYTFRQEIEAYTRLSNTFICPAFYGAFQGAGVTGFQTGIILLEKIPMLSFSEFRDMSEQERQTAYSHVVEMHQRGIHHGDILPQNFGRRGASVNSSELQQRTQDGTGIVICDFSHCSIFDHCDPETCPDLQLAKRDIIDLGMHEQ